MTIDPYNHKRVYQQWKTDGAPITGVTEENAHILTQFLADMEAGRNIGSGTKKGGPAPECFLPARVDGRHLSMVGS